jgi:hypothetical protein
VWPRGTATRLSRGGRPTSLPQTDPDLIARRAHENRANDGLSPFGPIEVLPEALQTAPPHVTPRRPSFRSTLDALSHAFVDAVLLAVRRAVLTHLAGALDIVPAKALPAARTASKAVWAARTPRRSKAAPPSVPARSSRARRTTTRHQLELPLDLHEHPDTVIVDPDAVLGALSPAAPVVAVRKAADVAILNQTVPSARPHRVPRRTRSMVAVPADEGRAAQVPQRAPDPVPRAGEEVLRAAGGGAVLRRRRAPIPPSPPTSAAE